MKKHLGSAPRHQHLLNIVLSVALVFAVAFAVSCKSQAPALLVPTGGDTPLAPTTGEPEPATPLQIEVAIQGSTFVPHTQNVPAEARILWYNADSVDHTVTARDNSFDSGRLSPNETFEYTFEQSGEVEYYCKIHPSMVGKIAVE
jgi:plastocyanin